MTNLPKVYSCKCIWLCRWYPWRPWQRLSRARKGKCVGLWPCVWSVLGPILESYLASRLRPTFDWGYHSLNKHGGKQIRSISLYIPRIPTSFRYKKISNSGNHNFEFLSKSSSNCKNVNKLWRHFFSNFLWHLKKVQTCLDSRMIYQIKIQYLLAWKDAEHHWPFWAHSSRLQGLLWFLQPLDQ